MVRRRNKSGLVACLPGWVPGWVPECLNRECVRDANDTDYSQYIADPCVFTADKLSLRRLVLVVREWCGAPQSIIISEYVHDLSEYREIGNICCLGLCTPLSTVGCTFTIVLPLLGTVHSSSFRPPTVRTMPSFAPGSSGYPHSRSGLSVLCVRHSRT